LVDRFGVASGERVAVLARNHPLLLLLQLGCARSGTIFVPLNWRLAKTELAAIAADAAPALLFVDPHFEFHLDGVPTLQLVELEGLGVEGTAPPVEARLSWDSPMTILYTSGTSGLPKGVIISEANAFWGNCNFALGCQVNADSIFLCDMPMFHTAGLFAAVRAPLWAGGSVWISAGFDPTRTIERIADPKLGITHYFSVPQMAGTLWQHPDFEAASFARLTLYATGGAPNPPAQIERYARAGIRMSDGFGMSETGSNFGMPARSIDTIIAKAGSCGLPFLSVEARIVDDRGRDVLPGEPGELLIRGPSVTPGYWGKPELTAAAFVHGWFRTGDIARQDEDGFFYLIDRRKDMFISGGENVYPAEVEAVLAELADVANCAVIGTPDARWGEVGRAFIVVREGSSLTVEAIMHHCRDRLARFKVPADVRLVDDLPQTGSGKILKHQLPRE
jgi:fatty-acyl-CoA synthase